MGPEKFFGGFPKFLKAIHNKDYDTAIEEYHSNAGENRNNYRLDYLNTIKEKYKQNGNVHGKKRRHLNQKLQIDSELRFRSLQKKSHR